MRRRYRMTSVIIETQYGGAQPVWYRLHAANVTDDKSSSCVRRVVGGESRGWAETTEDADSGTNRKPREKHSPTLSAELSEKRRGKEKDARA